jgi:hypothetical protein
MVRGFLFLGNLATGYFLSEIYSIGNCFLGRIHPVR